MADQGQSGGGALGTAVITGAAVARALREAGYELALIDVSEEPLARIAAELDARYAVADLSDEGAAVDEALDGRAPKALANVAGMNTRAPLLEMTQRPGRRWKR